MRGGAQRGFTLLEVLVALAILTIVMTALVGTVSQSVRNIRYLEDRTLTHWVALNQIAKYQLETGAARPDESRGVEDMGGRRWYWRRRVTETPNADVNKLVVSVGADETNASPVTTLTAFVSAPGR